MKLKVYLADIGMTLKDFGSLLDCDPKYLSLIDKGKMLPSPRLAQEIERATSGIVKVRASEKAILRKQKRKEARREELRALLEAFDKS